MCNDNVLDLKKLIEYDQKHNVNVLSSSLSKEWCQSYSERMKTSTPIKNDTYTDPSPPANIEKQQCYLKSNTPNITFKNRTHNIH